MLGENSEGVVCAAEEVAVVDWVEAKRRLESTMGWEAKMLAAPILLPDRKLIAEGQGSGLPLLRRLVPNCLWLDSTCRDMACLGIERTGALERICASLVRILDSN